MNAHPDYRRLVTAEAVARSPASRWLAAPDLFDAMQSMRPLRRAVRRAAGALPSSSSGSATTSGCSASGPRTGLAEIYLPAGAARLVHHARQGQSGDGRRC
ncbi:MAG: hypothetical protein MZV49_15550 [Rhodopseudomonas palustris]|nr:hypothetical protein [Rhodopseudomonas palustris]